MEWTPRDIGLAIGTGLLSIFAGLRLRRRQKRSEALLVPPPDREVRLVTRKEYRDLEASAAQGAEAALELVELRRRFEDHCVMDGAVHDRVGRLEGLVEGLMLRRRR